MQGKELENFSINGKNWKWKLLGKFKTKFIMCIKGKVREIKKLGDKKIIVNIVINMRDAIRKACA